MVQPHPLIEDFPELGDAFRRLNVEDAEFRALYDEYHDVDNHIVRIEQNTEPTADDYCNQLKRHRLYLKDRLIQMVRESSAAAP